MAIKSQNTRVDFTGYLPQGLLNVNSPTQSLAWETTTQLSISTGAVQGKRFYLSEATAQQLSNNTCHEGWYRIVQVDAAATADLIAFGYGGAMVSVADGPDVDVRLGALEFCLGHDYLSLALPCFSTNAL